MGLTQRQRTGRKNDGDPDLRTRKGKTMAESSYSGCVYHAPNQNEYSPVNVEDLSSRQLRDMQLTGLPIRAAHGKYVGDDIGTITDEWQGPDGSKFISFSLSKEPKYAGYTEGVSQQWYTHLSLGHEIDAEKGMVPREVSICHRGARENTFIANPRMKPQQYKALTLAGRIDLENPGAMAEDMQTQPETAPEAASVELSPEEQALNTIRTLDQEKQEIIAKGWSSTSSRLEELNGKLSSAEKELEAARAELAKASKENETLKVATKETAAHLVIIFPSQYPIPCPLTRKRS